MSATSTDFTTWLRKDTHEIHIQQMKEERRSINVDMPNAIASATHFKFNEWGFTPSGKSLLPADVEDNDTDIDYENENYIF
jgi:hypothetical protein